MRTILRIFWEVLKRWFTKAIAIIAVGLWVLSSFISQISPQLATGVSLSALVIILTMVLGHLIALRKPAIITTKFHSNQSSAQDETIKLLEELGTRSKAQLIEYSSESVKEILNKLKSMEAEIELLICNPNFTITNDLERPFHSSHPGSSDFQKEKRICLTIGELHRITLGDYDKVKIKCYRTPGSLRGRNFGDRWFQVGWYTYQTAGDREVFGSPQIWGHRNPVITAPVSSPEGQVLKGMFNEVFEKLWGESDPLIDVCGKCSKSKRRTCFGSIQAANKWLQVVSPHEEK